MMILESVMLGSVPLLLLLAPQHVVLLQVVKWSFSSQLVHGGGDREVLCQGVVPRVDASWPVLATVEMP